MQKSSFVYMLTNSDNNAFYVDITSDLKRRMTLHKESPKGMVKDRHVNMLVLVDEFPDMPAAIKRQKEFKKMTKDEKIALVKKVNPTWRKMNADYLK